MSAHWTETQEHTLIERWKAGWSASLIAADIGKSRNAVIGKVDRMGLGPHEVERARPRTPEHRAKLRAAHRVQWSREHAAE